MSQGSKTKQRLCWRDKPDINGTPRRCLRPGYPVTLHGEFSDGQLILCRPCIAEVKAKGWKVSYMIKADEPEGGESAVNG